MYFLLVSLLLASATILNAQSEDLAVREFLENLKKTNYNPHVPPVGYQGAGSPIHVLATMYIIDVHKVDDFSMDYRASFYFRQSWNDTRLAFSGDDDKYITLQNKDTIWTPDLFFVQEKEGIKHNIIGPNDFIRVWPNGEAKYSTRLSLTFSCAMDFRRYPHDEQKCRFSVESYGRSRDQMLLDWDERPRSLLNGYGPVGNTETINVLSFELTDIENSAEDVDFTSGGKYRALIVTLTFKRKIGFYMTRLYIPFLFLVSLSWLSFWIKSKLVTLRLSLLLVIMYLMITIGSDISCYIPPAPYTKSSDIWIAFCESLVFAAFLEFIFVSIVDRAEEKRKKKLDDSEFGIKVDSALLCNEKSSNSETHGNVQKISSRLSKITKSSHYVDMLAKILFPLFFILFNIFYWLV